MLTLSLVNVAIGVGTITLPDLLPGYGFLYSTDGSGNNQILSTTAPDGSIFYFTARLPA